MMRLRKTKKIAEIQVEKHLDVYVGDPTALIKVLQEFMDDHEDCSLDFDCESYYDSTTHKWKITGWRVATDAEINADRKLKALEKNRTDQRRLEQLEQARNLLRAAGEL